MPLAAPAAAERQPATPAPWPPRLPWPPATRRGTRTARAPARPAAGRQAQHPQPARNGRSTAGPPAPEPGRHQRPAQRPDHVHVAAERVGLAEVTEGAGKRPPAIAKASGPTRSAPRAPTTAARAPATRSTASDQPHRLPAARQVRRQHQRQGQLQPTGHLEPAARQSGAPQALVSRARSISASGHSRPRLGSQTRRATRPGPAGRRQPRPRARAPASTRHRPGAGRPAGRTARPRPRGQGQGWPSGGGQRRGAAGAEGQRRWGRQARPPPARPGRPPRRAVGRAGSHRASSALTAPALTGPTRRGTTRSSPPCLRQVDRRLPAQLLSGASDVGASSHGSPDATRAAPGTPGRPGCPWRR